MLHRLRIVNVLFLVVCISCTRTSSQSADAGNARGGGTRAGSDRELPGYLVFTSDRLVEMHFPVGRTITDHVLNGAVAAYVTSGNTGITGLTSPVEIQMSEVPTGDEISTTPVQVCTTAAGISANTGVALISQRIFIPPTHMYFDEHRVCFAALFSLIYGDEAFVFVDAIDGSPPAGYTAVSRDQEPTHLTAAWASDTGPAQISFASTSGQASRRHMLGMNRATQPMDTCAGGYSALNEPGVYQATIDELNPAESWLVRVCTIDALGIASPGTTFDLAPWSPPAEPPPDVPSGAHLIFVTADTYPGDLGGLTGADAVCQFSANAASLPGTWKAVLSDTGTSAASRLQSTGEVFNMLGQRIAPNLSALWLTSILELEHSVQFDQNGETTWQGIRHAWTGTEVDGTSAYDNCNNWTSNDPVNYEGGIGDFTRTTSLWIKDARFDCDQAFPLYCINGQ